MNRYRALLLILLTVLFSVVMFTRADEPVEESWLIFTTAFGESRGDVYRMRLDGSGLQNLTQAADGLSTSFLSRDRQWLYFNAFVDDDVQIFRVRTDGSERQQLTDTGRNFFHTVSPDGEWIFYSPDTPWEIHRMRADGSDSSRVFERFYFPEHFGWSPDGQWMFFESVDEALTERLYRMSADGSILDGVTADLEAQGIEYNRFSEYSGFIPGGEWLMFACGVPERTSTICRMRYDGSDAGELTPFNTSNDFIAWSPDGAWFYFYSASDEGSGIYRMHPDGSEVQPVIDFAGKTGFYGFTPDEQHLLVYAGEFSGQKDLYRVNLDGSEPEKLLSTDQSLFYPAWSPDGQWLLMNLSPEWVSAMDIYRASADGTQFDQITSTPGFYLPLGWSSDSEWFIYFGGKTTASVTGMEGYFYRLNMTTLEVQQLTPELAQFALGNIDLIEGY